MSDYLFRPGGGGETRRRRFSNLPIWAQEELNRLSRELDNVEHRLASTHENSDTWAEPYAKVPTPFGRPKVIRHRYADGMEATITWRDDERPLTVPRMEIMITSGKPVIELGGASNVVTLRLESDR